MTINSVIPKVKRRHKCCLYCTLTLLFATVPFRDNLYGRAEGIIARGENMMPGDVSPKRDGSQVTALSSREKYLSRLKSAEQLGVSRLVLAAQSGDLEMVKTLISEGVDLDEPSRQVMGMRLIEEGALSSGRLRELEASARVLQSLLPEESKGQGPGLAKPDIGPSNETALIAASRAGFTDIVRVLLDAGAQIEKKAAWGATALCAAAQSGHYEITELLLSRGANPFFDGPNRGALIQAAVTGGNADILNLALRYPHDVDAQTANGATALLVAARDRRYDLAKELLNHGASVNIRDNEGTTTLIAAAPDDDSSLPADTRLMALLIEHGADVNAADTNGWTALMSAAFFNDLGLAKMLVSAGANISAIDSKGRTPINLAVETKHHEMEEFLKVK